MKYVAVFLAFVQGHPAVIDDIDGPNEFPTYQACADHARVAAPKLQTILRDYLPWERDLNVTWECRKLDDPKPE